MFGEMDRMGIAKNFAQIIQIVEGNEQIRDGMKKTPDRVAKAYMEWFRGYHMIPEEILSATFDDDGLASYKGLVQVRDIEFYSFCEHHIAPFFGSVTVGYIPQERVVGLSKLARLVDCFACRFQVQERLTDQIADALMEHLQPLGAMVIARATHTCMCSRGVKKQHSDTVTSAVRGVFFDDARARTEFMELARWK